MTVLVVGCMATFTPPTYNTGIVHDRQSPLWRFYDDAIEVGYSVLITGGTATAAPGVVSPPIGDVNATDDGSGENGRAWFRGGIPYEITSAEETILTNAGYGDYIE